MRYTFKDYSRIRKMIREAKDEEVIKALVARKVVIVKYLMEFGHLEDACRTQ